jgi:hypothetical protein
VYVGKPKTWMEVTHMHAALCVNGCVCAAACMRACLASHPAPPTRTWRRSHPQRRRPSSPACSRRRHATQSQAA